MLAPADRSPNHSITSPYTLGVALDRRRQVEDDRPVVTWLDDVHHPLADLDGEVRLGEGEALGEYS